MNISRKNLEKIMRAKPGEELSHEEFRLAVEEFYNFGLQPGDLSEPELQALKALFDVVVWYSPLPSERQSIAHYRDEEDVERAWAAARVVLMYPMVDYLGTLGVETPTEAAALWKLHLIERHQLPLIAEALLVKGYDSPSLRRLAAEEPGNYENLDRQFDSSLHTLGSNHFASERMAADWLVHAIAAKITKGTVDPYRGARAIWMISLAEGVGSLEQAQPFILAAKGWEGRFVTMHSKA